MLKRMLMARLAGLSILGLAMLLVASIVAIPASRRASLDAFVLADSRGSNQGYVLAQYSCDGLQGNYFCTTPGATCATCTTRTVTGVSAGINGGYTGGAGTQACGSNLVGTCTGTTTLSCTANPVKRPLGSCPTESDIVVQ